MAMSRIDQQQQALCDDDDQRPEIAVQNEVGHRALLRRRHARAASASAEHSAITAEARAIGLVR